MRMGWGGEGPTWVGERGLGRARIEDPTDTCLLYPSPTIPTILGASAPSASSHTGGARPVLSSLPCLPGLRGIVKKSWNKE